MAAIQDEDADRKLIEEETMDIPGANLSSFCTGRNSGQHGPALDLRFAPSDLPSCEQAQADQRPTRPATIATPSRFLLEGPDRHEYRQDIESESGYSCPRHPESKDSKLLQEATIPAGLRQNGRDLAGSREDPNFSPSNASLLRGVYPLTSNNVRQLTMQLADPKGSVTADSPRSPAEVIAEIDEEHGSMTESSKSASNRNAYRPDGGAAPTLLEVDGACTAPSQYSSAHSAHHRGDSAAADSERFDSGSESKNGITVTDNEYSDESERSSDCSGVMTGDGDGDINGSEISRANADAPSAHDKDSEVRERVLLSHCDYQYPKDTVDLLRAGGKYEPAGAGGTMFNDKRRRRKGPQRSSRPNLIMPSLQGTDSNDGSLPGRDEPANDIRDSRHVPRRFPVGLEMTEHSSKEVADRDNVWIKATAGETARGNAKMFASLMRQPFSEEKKVTTKTSCLDRTEQMVAGEAGGDGKGEPEEDGGDEPEMDKADAFREIIKKQTAGRLAWYFRLR
jgi:hypothetical protein